MEEAPPLADDWEKVVKENKILLHVIDARRPADTIVEDVSEFIISGMELSIVGEIILMRETCPFEDI